MQWRTERDARVAQDAREEAAQRRVQVAGPVELEDVLRLERLARHVRARARVRAAGPGGLLLRERLRREVVAEEPDDAGAEHDDARAERVAHHVKQHAADVHVARVVRVPVSAEVRVSVSASVCVRVRLGLLPPLAHAALRDERNSLSRGHLSPAVRVSCQRVRGYRLARDACAHVGRLGQRFDGRLAWARRGRRELGDERRLRRARVQRRMFALFTGRERCAASGEDGRDKSRAAGGRHLRHEEHLYRRLEPEAIAVSVSVALIGTLEARLRPTGRLDVRVRLSGVALAFAPELDQLARLLDLLLVARLAEAAVLEQQEQRDHVDEQPDAAHDHHELRVRDRLRLQEALERAHHHRHAQAAEQHRVGERAEDLSARVPIRVHLCRAPLRHLSTVKNVRE